MIGLIIVVAVLFVRDRSRNRVADGEISSWQATRETRPIPNELRHVREVVAAQWVLGGARTVRARSRSRLFMGQSRVLLAGTIGIFAMIGISLVVLTGWAGQVSLGQVAVVGISAAAARIADDPLPLGHVARDARGRLRRRGRDDGRRACRRCAPAACSFAVTTLALALVTSSYLLNPQFFSSWLPQGRIERTEVSARSRSASETRFYVLILVMLGLTLVAVRGLRTSRTGRVLIGTRENERAAESYGIDARRAVVIAFAVSGFISGVAGALFVHQQRALDLANFQPDAALTRLLDGRRRRARIDVRRDRGRDLRAGHRLVPAVGVVVPRDRRRACCSC